MCGSEILFLDFDTGESITLQDNDLDIAIRNITFTTAQLKANRHYDVAIQAWNSHGNATSYTAISEGAFMKLLFMYINELLFVHPCLQVHTT